MEMPEMKSFFLRDDNPDFILTADFGTDSFSAMNAHKAALAFPSTGGEVRDIFRASP